MSAHHRTLCLHCATQISTCRCPALDKTIRWDICSDFNGCRGRQAEQALARDERAKRPGVGHPP